MRSILSLVLAEHFLNGICIRVNSIRIEGKQMRTFLFSENGIFNFGLTNSKGNITLDKINSLEDPRGVIGDVWEEVGYCLFFYISI